MVLEQTARLEYLSILSCLQSSKVEKFALISLSKSVGFSCVSVNNNKSELKTFGSHLTSKGSHM